MRISYWSQTFALPIYRPMGSGARGIAADGTVARAEVVGFRGGRALLVPLDLDAPHENGARVEPDSAANMVQVGDSLMGRVVDATGMPLDRKGPIMANAYWPLAGVKGNVLDRGRVTEPFDLGVRAVNALLTAGRGQRIAIIAGSGVGKSRSEEHTSELQSLMRISYAVFCL